MCRTRKIIFKKSEKLVHLCFISELYTIFVLFVVVTVASLSYFLVGPTTDYLPINIGQIDTIGNSQI